MKIPIVEGNCTGCCYCIMVCPVGAAGPINPKKVLAEKCTGCGKCVSVCPQGARVMRDVAPNTVVGGAPAKLIKQL